MAVIMQFGKKWLGKPVDQMVVEAPYYCRWLMTVPSFEIHHPALYALVREAVIKELQLESDVEALL